MRISQSFMLCSFLYHFIKQSKNNFAAGENSEAVEKNLKGFKDKTCGL